MGKNMKFKKKNKNTINKKRSENNDERRKPHTDPMIRSLENRRWLCDVTSHTNFVLSFDVNGIFKLDFRAIGWSDRWVVCGVLYFFSELCLSLK